MTKKEINHWLEKINAVEKIIFRDLNHAEIDFLKEHSIEELLYDVLCITKEDLKTLGTISELLKFWTVQEDTYKDFKGNTLFDLPEDEADCIKENPKKTVDNKLKHICQALSALIGTPASKVHLLSDSTTPSYGFSLEHVWPAELLTWKRYLSTEKERELFKKFQQLTSDSEMGEWSDEVKDTALETLYEDLMVDGSLPLPEEDEIKDEFIELCKTRHDKVAIFNTVIYVK